MSDLAAALDPNIAALIGGGHGANDQFAKMLMQSLNPNAASNLQSQIGPPDLGPLEALSNNAPPVQTGQVAPALPPAQTLESMGFGMAAAAGKPGSSALSALGEGGNNMLQLGNSEADRSLREAQMENAANLQQWEGKSRLAETALNAQMKEPELDMRMMDLTGTTLGRDAQIADTAAYRAALAQNATAKTGVAQQNADTAAARLGVSQQRADTYDTSVTGNQALKAQQLQIQQTKIDQAASQFQQSLLEKTRATGSRIGLEAAQMAAQEFKNEMQLRKNPITGELPDSSVQAALQQTIESKYMAQAQGAMAPAPKTPAPAQQPVQQNGQSALAAKKYQPGDTVFVKGKPYMVGDDGDTLVPQ